MMVSINDYRDDQKKQTHIWGVLGTDKFMSNWGLADGGNSYACWACRFEDIPKVENLVLSRPEMVRVRIVDLRTYKPNSRNCKHLSIYPVDETHQALKE